MKLKKKLDYIFFATKNIIFKSHHTDFKVNKGGKPHAIQVYQKSRKLPSTAFFSLKLHSTDKNLKWLSHASRKNHPS